MNADDPVLVLGAAGNVGAPLVADLAARGVPVRAATRDGRALPGATGVRVDIADPATLAPAFDGVRAAHVMLPAGSTDPLGLLSPVVGIAAARGVKVVLQSVFGADASEDIPYRRVERLLEGSGVPHVILRPNWFADNFHTYWLHDVRAGELVVPAGDGRSSFVDARDIAAASAAALLDDRFDGRAFALTGPAAHGYGEAAAILSAVAGHEVRYRPVDDDAFVARLTGVGVPADYAAFLAAIFHPVREGWTAAVSDAVETLTGRPPRDLRTYAADRAALFRQAVPTSVATKAATPA